MPSKGKGLTLLRLCNDVIRRLSKPTRSHTIFAGRVLSLLSAVLPLGERSGVNLRGDFNVDNKTVWEPTEEEEQKAEEEDDGKDELTNAPVESKEGEDDEEVVKKSDVAEEDGERRSSREATTPALAGAEQRAGQTDEELLRYLQDPSFYTLFWKQQDYLSNPLLLLASKGESSDGGDEEGEEASVLVPKGCVDPAPEGRKGPMRILRLAVRITVSLFAAVARRERELAGKAQREEAAKLGGSTAPSHSSSSASATKSRSNRHDIDKDTMELDDAHVVEDVTTTASNHGDDDYFPKYLTGRNLLEYEVRDEKFRRHVLVQYLILFQYLLGFTAAQREKAAAWKNQALANSTTFVLDEADDRWLRDTWKEIVMQLKQTHTAVSSKSSSKANGAANAMKTTEEGRVFSDSVLQVLRREQRWLNWKAESCSSIDKASLSEDQINRFIGVDALRPTLRVLRPFPHKVGTAALSNLWEDGVKRPEPSKRTMEDAEGNEIQVDTDGLDELEWPPTIPSLEDYAAQIRSLEGKMGSRRQDLGIDVPAKIKVLGLQISAEVRESETKRRKREADDESMAEWSDQRAGLSWKAMRLARNTHVAHFAKVKVDDVLAIFRTKEEEEAEEGNSKGQEEKTSTAAEEEEKSAADGDAAMKGVIEVVAPSEPIADAAKPSSAGGEAKDAKGEPSSESKDQASDVHPLQTDEETAKADAGDVKTEDEATAAPPASAEDVAMEQ